MNANVALTTSLPTHFTYEPDDKSVMCLTSGKKVLTDNPVVVNLNSQIFDLIICL